LTLSAEDGTHVGNPCVLSVGDKTKTSSDYSVQSARDGFNRIIIRSDYIILYSYFYCFYFVFIFTTHGPRQQFETHTGIKVIKVKRLGACARD